MSTVDVCVSQYELWLDASETIRAVLDSGDVERAAGLSEGLTLATRGPLGPAVFAVPAEMPVCAEDFRPDTEEDPDRPEISTTGEEDVLVKLERAGFVRLGDVWSECSSTAYLDDGRRLISVEVLRAFRLVSVTYRWSRPGALGYADRWEITDQTPVIDTGAYLVGLVGDWALKLVGVTGVHTDDPERLTYWAVEIEGFGASHCSAECATCRARWLAESGSWHFRPDPDDGTDTGGWDFDDADGFDEHDTVTCPACGTGRVGFLIF